MIQVKNMLVESSQKGGGGSRGYSQAQSGVAT